MTYFVYIMSNANRTLYTGIISDLVRTHAKKVTLIEKKNPDWKDLSVTWRDVLT